MRRRRWRISKNECSSKTR